MTYDLTSGSDKEKRNRAKKTSDQIDRDNKQHEEGGHGKGRMFAFIVLVILAMAMFFGNVKAAELKVTVMNSATVSSNAKDSLTINYVQKCVRAWADSPHSYNLHRLSGSLFFATLLDNPRKPSELFSYYADCSDDFRRRSLLLINNTNWFTDYVYVDPVFNWNEYQFEYDHKLADRKFWLTNDGQRHEALTWGKVVCLVMDIEYDAEFDYGLYVPPLYVATSAEDRSLFIGPKQ